MKAIIIAVTLLLATSNSISAQNCTPSFIPDLPLDPSSATIMTEIDNVYSEAKDRGLSKVPPSSSDVTNAINTYNNLNITINNGTISGNTITSYNQVSFIKTFANYLRFNPTDTQMIERANNTIWLVYENLCNGTLTNLSDYVSRNFSRGASFCMEYLDSDSKERYLYIMERNSHNWNVFWEPSYNSDAQLSVGAISTDFIYNTLDSFIPMVNCFETDDEQYRFMKTFQRLIKRFMSVHTNGTHDGLKPDGSGYHHWNNYEAYMYAYNTVVYCLGILDNSMFQIDASTYLTFRDAMLHKHLVANDDDIMPLAISGRSGNWESNTVSQDALKNLAIIGGNILGLSTADPVLAGIYNRKYGVDTDFNVSNISPFENGFYQNNHAGSGIFRTNNVVVINKGMSNQLWGSEIYSNSNRYGRYNGYGALAVVYPGSASDNGFDNTNWDWNYHPGATTKVLAWNELMAGWNRMDLYSNKSFSGSLQIGLQNKGYLNKVFGTYGMFAMDFQERANQGWSGVTAPETHDETFTFKKSNFFFDDVIICLATGITNTDSDSPTVTTLYQDTTNPNDVTVNNNIYTEIGSTTTYSGINDNWVLDNHGTGYYIVSGSGDLKLQRKDQTTPSQNQTDPNITNPASQAAIGYIDHETAPTNSGYEYVIVPDTDLSSMQTLSSMFQNNNKPYEVINKDYNSHIIRHEATGIYAFALFEPNSTLSGNTNIVANSANCLIMYQSDNSSNTSMTFSLSNPDLGLPERKSYDIFPVQKIQITFNGSWQLPNSHPDITFVSLSSGNSIYEFATYQGLPIEAKFEKSTLSKDIPNVLGSAILAVFPNPTTNMVRVKTNSLSTWEIYDINGKLLLSGQNTKLEFDINISNLQSGKYFLSIGTSRNSFKILKE